MTKINVWKCDICKKEFRPDDSGYGSNAPLSINIPSASQWEIEHNFDFDDTCVNCRTNLSIAIDKLIK